MVYKGYKLGTSKSDFDLNWYKNVYKEIWEDHEYNRYGVSINEGDIVIDCGANVGMFSNYAIDYLKAKTVYSFESDPTFVECLRENTKDRNVIITHGYVSDRTEKGHYNIDKILDENNLSYIDFAKIDIEWWEYPLLINMSNQTMKKINKWVIEVHSINNHSGKVLNIIEKFSKNGFDVNYEQIHKQTTLGLLYAKKVRI